ncbi:MAG: hypothetical protein QOG97_2849 [Acidimicrobiaceae bacterium]|nr:hypothetical protein [Acidimicrobiaceae bacterium]
MPSKGILVALAEQLNLGVLGGRFEARLLWLSADYCALTSPTAISSQRCPSGCRVRFVQGGLCWCLLSSNDRRRGPVPRGA